MKEIPMARALYKSPAELSKVNFAGLEPDQGGNHRAASNSRTKGELVAWVVSGHNRSPVAAPGQR
jgi:hypothetical protein